MANKQGKFIVIDGTDGSGKATQTRLLVHRLHQAGLSVALADFPQYGTKSAGPVEEYLNKKYGSAIDVGPHRASIFYAVDRYDASFKIREWLNQGKIVISNRYVTSNMAHQGGKIISPLERQVFLDWLHQLEYGIFDIPKPDLNIILHVDAEIAQKLVDKKSDRSYLKNRKRDLHEDDIGHLRAAERVYLEIANDFPDITLIECTHNHQIMSKKDINNLLWLEVNKLLNLPDIQSAYTDDFEYDFKQIHHSVENLQNYSGRLLVERLSSNAKIPTRAYKHDAGLDLYSSDYYSLIPGKQAIISTGIRIAIPPGHVGLIWDKGGVAKEGVHAIAGVVDAGFRGEVTVNLVNLGHEIYNIGPGEKIAQMLIQKVEDLDILETEISDSTERKDGRFGSSGKY